MNAATVRIVVVTYFPGSYLEALVDSLPDACSAPYEVVISNNASTDSLPQQIANRYGCTLINCGGNLGYGAAANRGVEGAGTPYLIICNPDLRFERGSIDELLAAAARWPDGGAFGPAIYDQVGDLYPSARELPIVSHGLGHAVMARFWPSNPWTRAYRQAEQAVRERPTGWLSGACLLLRREAFQSVGGFDPGYFMYFEDVDLGDRLARAGWNNVYVPVARVTHVGAGSTSRNVEAMVDAHHASAYRYLSSRYGMGWKWLFRIGLAGRKWLIKAEIRLQQRSSSGTPRQRESARHTKTRASRHQH